MAKMELNTIRGDFTVNHNRYIYTAKYNYCLDLDSKEIRDRPKKDD